MPRCPGGVGFISSRRRTKARMIWMLTAVSGIHPGASKVVDSSGRV